MIIACWHSTLVLSASDVKSEPGDVVGDEHRAGCDPTVPVERPEVAKAVVSERGGKPRVEESMRSRHSRRRASHTVRQSRVRSVLVVPIRECLEILRATSEKVERP